MTQQNPEKSLPTVESPPSQRLEPSSVRTAGHAPSLAGTLASRLPLDSQTTQAHSLDPAARSQTEVPSVVGYEIQEVLGRGGMGVVYKAYQPKLDRFVALKMILAGAHASPQELERFRREAQAVARLHHPNIVQIHEVGEQEGFPFFSLEYLEGGTLAGKLAGMPLPAREAAILAEIVARAVQHAHANGIVHRDLKPANILLDADGTLKVADFGLAKRLEEDVGQTQSGTIVGTPSYMAPEQAQAQSEAIGPRTDVYSLGALLYEMLTGRPPFRAATRMDTMLQVISQDPVPPTRLEPKVPRDLETICMKCLQKEPVRRYTTADALAEDLRRFLAGEPIVARPAGLPERAVKWARRRPAIAALLGLIILVTGAGFGLVTWQWQHAETAKEKAEVARKEAETAQRKAEEQKRRFQHLSASLLLEKGQNLCEQQDVGRGLLWLARSLQVAPADDADLQRVIRTNLSDWQRRFYPLVGTFSHEKRIQAIAFSPNGKIVLTSSYDRTARLWDITSGQPIGTPMKHKGSIPVVAFSPNGKIVLTGSHDNTARLWDVKTSRPIGKPLKHEGVVLAVAFSPTGKSVLTASADNTARLWDAATGKPIGVPMRHDLAVRAIAFSPRSGKIVVTGSVDKTARLWDASTGKPLSEPLLHDKGVVAIAFSPDEKLLGTTSEDRTARLWNAASGNPHVQPLRHEGTVTALAFSPNSTLLITGSTDHNAYFWRVSNGDKLGLLSHGAIVRTVAISPDGNTVFTGSDDQTVRLWHRASRQFLGTLPHQSEVMTVLIGSKGKTVLTATSKDRTARLWDVARRPSQDITVSGHTLQLGGLMSECLATVFSPDGKLILTGCADGTAQLWDAVTGERVRGPLLHQGPVGAVAFSGDGKTMLTGSRDKTAQLWAVATGKQIGPPQLHDGPVVAVKFSPDSKTAVTTSTDATARLWETATGKAIGQPLKHRRTVFTADFSPNGKTVMTATFDNTAQLWDAATGKSLDVIFKHQAAVLAAVFSPDGKLLATGSEDETAQIWDVSTGKSRSELKHQGPVLAVAFSPDGKLLLTGSDDRTARLWNVTTGKPVCPPMTHQRGVRAIAFSPDGKTMLTGSRDGTSRFWDTATGRQMGIPLKHPLREVLGVAFSPDGKRVVTAGEFKVARIWKVPIPVTGEVKRIVLWTQVLTGMELDADGAVGALDSVRWHERLADLEKQGGPPLP